MKKSLSKILFGTLAVSLGLSSCKKDKDEGKDCCATVTYEGDTYTFCVGDDGMTQAEFDAYVAFYKKMPGYSVKTKKCK